MSQLRDADPASQDLADVFRGDAEAGYSLKDANSGKGISANSVPAFVAGEELADLADDDERIAVLTADLSFANRTMDFAVRHPDRFFNVGVAEQNMIARTASRPTNPRVASRIRACALEYAVRSASISRLSLSGK